MHSLNPKTRPGLTRTPEGRGVLNHPRLTSQSTILTLTSLRKKSTKKENLQDGTDIAASARNLPRPRWLVAHPVKILVDSTSSAKTATNFNTGPLPQSPKKHEKSLQQWLQMAKSSLNLMKSGPPKHGIHLQNQPQLSKKFLSTSRTPLQPSPNSNLNSKISNQIQPQNLPLNKLLKTTLTIPNLTPPLILSPEWMRSNLRHSCSQLPQVQTSPMPTLNRSNQPNNPNKLSPQRRPKTSSSQSSPHIRTEDQREPQLAPLPTTRIKKKKVSKARNYAPTTHVVLCMLAQANSVPLHGLHKSLLNSRLSFNQKNKISRIPHPNKSHHVIYVAFSKLPNHPHRYVGKTSGTCFTRRLSEIQAAHSPRTATLPLSKFINRVHPENFILIPLQVVEDWSQAHFYERYWINRLRSNYRIHPHGLNLSSEHTPVKTNRDVLRTPETSQALSKVVQRHRRSHDVLHKTNIITYLLVNESHLAESYLRSLSMKNLYRILSNINNRWENPNPSSTPPNPQLMLEAHQYVKTNLTQTQLTTLQSMVQLIIDQRIRLPRIKRFNTSLPIYTTTYLNPIISKLGITSLISKLLRTHFRFLPDYQPRLVTKSLPNLGQLLFNYKKETKSLKIDNHLRPNGLPCSCHLQQLLPFLNSYGHVSTCSPDLILALPLPDKSSTHLLISKGAGFVPQPQLSPLTIKKEVLQSCKLFAGKLKSRYKLPPFLIKRFLSDAYRSCNKLFHSIDLQTPEHALTQNQTFSLKTLKSLFIITPTDKLPKNLNFTCKQHWFESLYNSLSLHPKVELARSLHFGPPIKPPPHQAIFHFLPGTPDLRIPPPSNFHLPTSSPPALAYVLTHKTVSAIIGEHKAFLKTHSFKSHNTLPTKALLPKHHKPGTRPLVTAYRVTTSYLSKHLASALNAVLDAIKDKYPDMYFPIKSSRDITTLITALNLSDSYTQDYIRAKDISGCYDNIDHDDLKWVIRNIIPVPIDT